MHATAHQQSSLHRLVGHDRRDTAAAESPPSTAGETGDGRGDRGGPGSADEDSGDAAGRDPMPSEWHRRPANSSGPCLFCGMRRKFRGLHRRIDDPLTGPRFVKRVKSSTGWREVCFEAEGREEPTRAPKTPSAKPGPAKGLEAETLVTVAQARKLFPKEPNKVTIRRWCRDGLKGVKLESTFIGSWRYTSHEAIRRFLDALNEKRFTPTGRERLPTGPTEDTRKRIAAAVRLEMFKGRNADQIAEELGVSTARVYEWKSNYKGLWKAAEESLAGKVISLVRSEAGTDAVLEDVDAYVGRAKAADKWAEARGESLFPESDKPTLCTFYRDYYLPVCLADGAESTKKGYTGVLRRWRLITGDPPLIEVTPELLAKFRDALARSRGMQTCKRATSQTVASKLRHVQTLLEKAGPPERRNRDAAGILEKVPWVRPPRTESRPVKIVEPGVLNDVYAAAVGMEKPRDCGFRPPAWWRALIVLSYNTGLRRGTIFRLRWDWLDREKRLFKIPGHSMKARRWHLAPLNETVMEHLRAIRRDQNELVLPWPHNKRHFDRHWHKLLDLAGLPRQEHFGLHDLRKTLATNLWGTNRDAAVVALGHASPMVTQNHYLDQTRIVAAALDALPQPSSFTQGRSA